MIASWARNTSAENKLGMGNGGSGFFRNGGGAFYFSSYFGLAYDVLPGTAPYTESSLNLASGIWEIRDRDADWTAG